MSKRSMLSLGLLALFVVLFARPAAAGGWVVVTLDDLPMAVQAGTKITVGLQVNQHGIHPLELPAGEVTIVMRSDGSKSRLESVAAASGKPGHYTAELEFPSAGVWRWEVRPGGYPAVPMPELTVGVAAQPAKQAEANQAAAWWLGFVRHVLSYLQQPQQQGAVSSAQKRVVNSSAGETNAAYGKQLFVAKGCATCHVHSAVKTTFSTEVGPNLTTYKVIPEYVKTWLKDPKALKPATAMPNLELKETEIDALVAFLSTNSH